MRYDELILNKHIDMVGYRAPYQKHSINNISICDTRQMEASIFEWPIAENKYGSPCQSISTMDYKMRHLPKNNNNESSSYVDKETLLFTVSFTDKIKIITLSQIVTVESLIGYIGGYVGLFLGRYTRYILQLYQNKIFYIMTKSKFISVI